MPLEQNYCWLQFADDSSDLENIADDCRRVQGWLQMGQVIVRDFEGFRVISIVTASDCSLLQVSAGYCKWLQVIVGDLNGDC